MVNSKQQNGQFINNHWWWSLPFICAKITYAVATLTTTWGEYYFLALEMRKAGPVERFGRWPKVTKGTSTTWSLPYDIHPHSFILLKNVKRSNFHLLVTEKICQSQILPWRGLFSEGYNTSAYHPQDKLKRVPTKTQRCCRSTSGGSTVIRSDSEHEWKLRQGLEGAAIPLKVRDNVKGIFSWGKLLSMGHPQGQAISWTPRGPNKRAQEQDGALIPQVLET